MMMAPNAFEPDQPGEPRYAEPTESTPEPTPGSASKPSQDLDALQRIVAESVSNLDDERIELSSMTPLVEVARCYPRDTFVACPIGDALVEAVLVDFFGATAPNVREGIKTLATRVNASLCDNPATRARIESLWIRLQDAVKDEGSGA